MCGLAGFYALRSEHSRAELHIFCQKMTDSIVHRGPDAGDIWQDPDHKLALGHRRLSIIDLSSAGAQPMHSHSGRYVITYNGEFYNYPALQRELETLGFVFKGRSDTEVFLAAVEQWGMNRALQKINGMFAFVLWDRHLKQLHFVRDRLGKKPLYIGWAGSSLIFGSELKSLRSHPQFKAELDENSAAQFLQRGWLNAPHSIYKNVWMLKPAHRMTIDITALKLLQNLEKMMEPYWHPLEIAQRNHGILQNKNESDIVSEFESLLQECVNDRMISDVPLGAFLSGGMDSSMIAALMQKLSNRPIKTYTIGFHENGFDEAHHAKKVASYLGSEHHEQYLSAQQAINIIPKLPQIFDEPFADMSAIPTYLVSQFARSDVTVALSGDGGDEMLGGYARHIQGTSIAKRMAILPKPLRRVLANSIQKIPPRIWNKVNSRHPQFGERMHKAANILRYNQNEEIYRGLINSIDIPPIGFTFSQDFLPALSDMLDFSEQMMLWDTLSYLPGDVLTKVDRASMACALETRAPLLDYRIFEYVWALPPHYKIRDHQGKWLLREVLARYLPRSFFDRPKQGFSIPIGPWLNGPLQDWAQSLLDFKTLQTDEILDAHKVLDLWQQHQSGHGNHTEALWSVLMFQSWKAHWL